MSSPRRHVQPDGLRKSGISDTFQRMSKLQPVVTERPFGPPKMVPFLMCLWTSSQMEPFWRTSCGEQHVFLHKGPVQNKFRHCPYCGGELRVQP